MHKGPLEVMHYALCIMELITWDPRQDPQKPSCYEIYALLRYAL